MEEREPVEPDETNDDEQTEEDDEGVKRRAVTSADDTGLVGGQEYINQAEDRPV